MEPRVAAILQVTSAPESARWYQLVGFEVRGEPPSDDDTWAEVRYGSLVLQFVSGTTPWPSAPNFTGCFYVHTMSVAEVFERVREVAQPEWGIERRPWGAVELTLQDPDGYFLTFTQDAETQ